MSYFGSKQWYAEVAAGRIPGHFVVHKYGRNSSGTINTEEPIVTSTVLNFPTSAQNVRIKSGGSSPDTASGTGAQEITIFGVDQNGSAASATLATNGPDASAYTSGSFWRVWRAFVSNSGSYVESSVSDEGTNQGQIIIENSGGQELLTIETNEGQSEHAAFAIPSNVTGFLLSVQVTVDTTKSADVIMYARNKLRDTANPKSKRLKLFFDGVGGQLTFNPQTPAKIGSDCDVWWTFVPTANGTECSVDFELLLIDNSLVQSNEYFE